MSGHLVSVDHLERALLAFPGGAETLSRELGPESLPQLQGNLVSCTATKWWDFHVARLP